MNSTQVFDVYGTLFSEAGGCESKVFAVGDVDTITAFRYAETVDCCA